ncbi:hypothetical protein ILUMI_04521 [Ignelater luminosus]|uniref:Uncharacterized protein n=1 Tax=Ignelater luminosus TaxID=2038154 RepID=A0A8K0GEH2_IGNLU|nr:hypothetical protein ILUMI_04521 [Ignelater luminosus]
MRLLQDEESDGLILLADKKEDSQHNLQVWCQKLEKHNLKINMDKTKTMSVKDIQEQTKAQMERRDPVLPDRDRTGMERQERMETANNGQNIQHWL